MNWSVIIIVALSAYLYLKARAVINLQYKLSGISGLTLFRSQIQFIINVNVFNPSSTSVTIDYANVNISLNTSFIGKCTLDKTAVIPKLSDGTFGIFCSIGLLDLIQAIPDLITSYKTKKAIFTTSGIVGGEGVKVEINTPITITIPKVELATKKTITFSENEKYQFVKGGIVEVTLNKTTYKLTA
jgi:LEA14-like dessication related protein